MRRPRIPLLSCLLLATGFLPSCEHDPLPSSGGSAFQADLYVGEWTGTWTNSTNNTTGPASFVVARAGDSALTLTIDLGGNVFGAGDPPAETFVLTLGASTATLTAQGTQTYGLLDGRLEADGTVTATATSVAVGNVRAFTVEGEWRTNDIDLELTLTYAPGSTPETARAALRLTKR